MEGNQLDSKNELVDIRIRSPATLVIAGPTGSGKTRLLADLISQATRVATPPPVEIIYCYSEWQKGFDAMSKNSDGIPIVFNQGMVDVKRELATDGKNRWLIIDDLMSEATEKGRSDALFTKHSHHLNLTVFLVVQNMFLKSLRTVSVNTHYFFVGKNPRDGSSVVNLAKQMSPGETGRFVEAYKDATREPYSFLFVSARQETPDRARLIKNYARPGKTMYAYVST